MVLKRVRILNGAFDPWTLQETVDRVAAFIESGQRGHVATVNVAILMMMRSDPRLQRFADSASFVLADGQPLIWASRLLSRPLPERVTGVDLVDALCARAARDGFGVYFLGARRDVVEAVAARMTGEHAGLRISGIADGYFSSAEEPERARAVAESGARLLFVGMGVPRQEHFLEDRWSELGVNVAIGVGGSFDVIAGLRRRAPRFVQRIGMEWMFRLVQEPRRLWRRYLVTNTLFTYHMLGELLSRGGSGSAKRIKDGKQG